MLTNSTLRYFAIFIIFISSIVKNQTIFGLDNKNSAEVNQKNYNKNQPKIVTSIVPIAAVVAMLMENEAEINSLAVNKTCPHHYHIRPSDLKKVGNADLVVYVNEQFDSFAAKLSDNHQGAIIKIGDLSRLRIISYHNQKNWHLWLDLYNIEVILEELAEHLANLFPQLKDKILYNLTKSKEKLKKLEQIKSDKLAALTDVILLNESAEYFFTKNILMDKLYQSSYKSLSYINDLKRSIARSKNKCIIITHDHDRRLYDKFNANLVWIESENWQLPIVTSQTFYDKYLEMINQVSKCSEYNFK